MRILLVEDDPVLAKVLSRRLIEHRYAVDIVSDGLAAWDYASTYEYDLLVLDVLLPKLDGISLCQRLRSTGDTTPILLLTAQDTSVAKVMGLDAGADDYVVKPFNDAELIARIRALLRRSSTNPLPILTWGDLWLNPSTCEVTYGEQPLTLSAKEYALLELLLRESQHVFSNEEILESLWSSAEFPVDATVRSHIRRLRQKLTAAGAPPDLIATAHGRGYYLKPLTPEETIASSRDPVSDVPMEVCGDRDVDPAADRLCCSIPSDPACLDNPSAPSPVSRSNDPSSAPLPDRASKLAQYQAMLHQIWLESQDKLRQQVQLLRETIATLQSRSLAPIEQEKANRAAHSLAGTLGTLGQLAGMERARELEQWLHGDVVLSAEDEPHLQALVEALDRDLAHPGSSDPPATLAAPWLLVVEADAELCDRLSLAAMQQGWVTQTRSTLAAAQDWLSHQEHTQDPLPIGLVLGLPSAGNQTLATRLGILQFLQAVSQQYPALPIVVLSATTSGRDRLEIVRRGAKSVLPRSIAPTQVMETIQHLRQASQLLQGTRVMLVDDDPILLRTLTTQLQSWGLDVSALNDPQQFWHVLESLRPEVLILDVQMPEMTGLELCQVLRSDPRWQQLPVLFLSIFADPQIQHQAFALGADDYLCKPISGIDLAHRILNRLQRIQAWAS